MKIFESNKLKSFEYYNWEVYSNGKREVSTKINEMIWNEWKINEMIWIEWMY